MNTRRYHMENKVDISNENKFFMLLKAALNLPGVQINRTEFLRKELSKNFKPEIVNLAIERNPAYAGISIEQIEKIAKSCINHETRNVSLISTAAGIPGGFAMLGTVPADAAQYFAHIIRILQKLVYLYGWKELYNATGEFDDETTDKLTLFIGVMFGVSAANAAVTKIAQSAALKTEKALVNKALTKGVIYPVVKNIASILGIKMTKEIFAKGVGKLIPIVGGIVSGGLTYATFKPAANNLKVHLKKLPTADVEYCKSYQDENIEIDFTFDFEPE